MPRLRILPLLALGLLAAPLGCGGDSFENEAEAPSNDGGASDASDARDAFEASPDAVHPDVADDVVVEAPPADAAEESDAAEEPGDLPLGAPCGPGDACESTHCIDGVCCESTCEACHVCDLPGSAGQCREAPDGTNPHDACGLPGEACSGTCDGMGACAYPPLGDPCGAVSCAPGGVDQVVPSCDGAGTCNDVTTSCGPYLCDAMTQSCYADCASTAGACVPEAYCDGTACQLKVADGVACVNGYECTSELCIDGVCCASACDGLCESCAQAGSLGSCLPIPDGTDPEVECVVNNDLTCLGTCNGLGGCAFPGPTQSCGAPVCNASNAQVESLCNGGGECELVPTACALYLCDDPSGLCHANCANDLACIDTAYCQTGACAPKKDDGSDCTAPNQCLSDFCESVPASMQKKCCNTLCPAPLNCSTGECLCSTVSCAVGVACVTWFEDWDQDTFGNPAEMLVGCEDTPPTDLAGHAYVRNSDDCYDDNANARPGQTALFGTHRGDFSFDYNCDNQETKEYDDTLPMGASQCLDCKASWNCVACGYLGNFWITHGYTCNSPCGPKQLVGFKGATNCGQSRTLFQCTNAANQCTNAEITTPNTVQRCN